MKKIATILIGFAVMALTASAQEMSFHSEEFAMGIRQHVGLGEEDIVLQIHTDTITVIDLSGLGITDIRDVECLSNVKMLDLSHNSISNTFPLTTLDSLCFVNLSDNLLESINPLVFSNAERMLVDISYNYIEDFSFFFTPAHCQFTLLGMDLQSQKDAPYFEVYQLFSETDAAQSSKVSYRGYTNMEDDVTLQCGSVQVPAALDGNYNMVEMSDVPLTPTKVVLTNGEQTDSTWMMPAISLDMKQSVSIDVPLPKGYSVGYAGALHGLVEVEGNSLKYDATKTCFSDVIQYTYYQGSQYRGSSYCTLKGNIVSGDVNGDDAINVTDVGMVIDHILDNTPENFIEAAADVSCSADRKGYTIYRNNEIYKQSVGSRTDL